MGVIVFFLLYESIFWPLDIFYISLINYYNIYPSLYV